MLTQIYIRDLATIEELHLNLQTASTMITGETGAGKSVFIEAIELGLGGRTSASIVRTSKEKAEISLCFDVRNFPRVIARLEELELHQDPVECIIRRVITQDGRSRSYINGSPVTLQLVKELGELLFHLHGQHEQQVLLKSDTQREMLDRYANHLPLVEDVKTIAENWRKVSQQIILIREKKLERSTRGEYLQFQLNELQELNLQVGEWENLEKEHHRLSHAEELLRQMQLAIHALTGNELHGELPINEAKDSISSLNNVRKIFESILNLEPTAAKWLGEINNVLIQVQDIENDLTNYLEKTDLDPIKIKQVEDRISEIYNLSRKHKTLPQDLLSFQERLQDEYTQLISCDEDLKALENTQKNLALQYEELANKLSTSRITSAKKLEKEITETIRSLSLPHGEFKISLELDATSFSTHGKEKVVFLIKTNPDQSPQPLAKVISGGELSRLSLAAHLALAHQTTIPTLIFDEIDTGLSGATAEKIGKLLRKLGKSYQVFSITHQPQVAAYGHHHLLVEKYFVKNSTFTRLRMLDNTERTREIARMLGGEKITKKTLDHAREVLFSV